MQHKQLFTDLTHSQAAVITAGSPTSTATASYGKASAVFKSAGLVSFGTSLSVKDTLQDGQPIYAKFQGLTAGGRLLTGSTKFFDRTETDAGMNYNLLSSFPKAVKKVRIAIYRSNRRGFVAGKWVNWANLG